MSSSSYKVDREKLIDSPIVLAASGQAGAVLTYGPYFVGRSSKFSLGYSMSGAGASPSIAVDYLISRELSSTPFKSSQSQTVNILTIDAEVLADMVPFDVDEAASWLSIRFSNNDNAAATIVWADFNHA